MEIIDDLFSLRLQLDDQSKRLTRTARCQVLIKIIYRLGEQVNYAQIASDFKRFLKKKDFPDATIESDLSYLIEQHEIQHTKGRYYLSTNKRSKIDKALQESENRLNDMVSRYFTNLYSSTTQITNWLKSATVIFFRNYSGQWISDLTTQYKSSSVKQSKDSIIATISRWTSKQADVDRGDHKLLPGKFLDFLFSRDPVVDTFLWEFGISCFSARLIAEDAGRDAITMDIFRDSYCVLDTNILIDLQLESEAKIDNLEALENIFTSLNISPIIFYITRLEYEHKVATKREEVLRLADKYDYELMRKASDDFIAAAVQVGCRELEDYDRFFSQMTNVPTGFGECEIQCVDNDKDIENAIEISQQNESEQQQLSDIYFSLHNREKRTNPLIHDVGLIGGVIYMKRDRKEKAFILTRDSAINEYSNQKPSEDNLPLSIKLETLINVLSIEEKAYDLDAVDFTELYADMIRNGLSPRTDCFVPEDMSHVHDLDSNVSRIPPQYAEDVLNTYHRLRFAGVPDEEVRLETVRLIDRYVNDTKLDLITAKEERDTANIERDRHKQRADNASRALKISIANAVESEYKHYVFCKAMSHWWILLVSLAVCVLCFSIGLLSNKNWYWGVIGAFLSVLLQSIVDIYPNWQSARKEKKRIMEEEIERRFNEALLDKQ